MPFLIAPAKHIGWILSGQQVEPHGSCGIRPALRLPQVQDDARKGHLEHYNHGTNLASQNEISISVLDVRLHLQEHRLPRHMAPSSRALPGVRAQVQHREAPWSIASVILQEVIAGNRGLEI